MDEDGVGTTFVDGRLGLPDGTETLGLVVVGLGAGLSADDAGPEVALEAEDRAVANPIVALSPTTPPTASHVAALLARAAGWRRRGGFGVGADDGGSGGG